MDLEVTLFFISLLLPSVVCPPPETFRISFHSAPPAVPWLSQLRVSLFAGGDELRNARRRGNPSTALGGMASV